MSFSQAPAPTPLSGRAAIIRVVAFHMTARIPSDGSLAEIEPVRLKPRSRAFRPRNSSWIFGLPVGISPSPSTVASKSPMAITRRKPSHWSKPSCLRYSQPISGKTSTSCSHMADSALRVPVIRMETITNPPVTASKAICPRLRARASNSAANGSVQVANSAKKLRLTKVEAGFGPCGKKRKSIQNCNAAHSAATTAPPWTAHASSGNRSRVSVFSPSHNSRLKMNQRIASTPAR